MPKSLWVNMYSLAAKLKLSCVERFTFPNLSFSLFIVCQLSEMYMSHIFLKMDKMKDLAVFKNYVAPMEIHNQIVIIIGNVATFKAMVFKWWVEFTKWWVGW